MHIYRADDSYFARLFTRVEDGGFWVLHRNGINPPSEDTGTDLSVKADAFIVRAAWRVSCPFCSGCQFGNPTQDRFMCVDCGNQNVNGAWIRVAWPDDLDEIEAALLARVNPTTMHWYPHETLEHLHAENVEHGIHSLEDVPKNRRRLVKHLVEAGKEVEPVHTVAAGTIVHEDSEWFPKYHAEVVKTLGKNVSESDIRRALYVVARGR